MTRPEVVVFDLGKVLLDFDYRIAAQALSGNGTCAPEGIVSLLLETPLLLLYERGLATTAEFYERFCSASGYHGSSESFAARFGAIFTPIEPMIALHHELRQAGFKTFVFSNTNELAIQYIRKTYPFFADFDDHILSYEHGSMKPDPGIYAVVETKCRRRGPAILYLDDRPENIAAGAERGWRTILHQSPEQTIPQVRKLLQFPVNRVPAA